MPNANYTPTMQNLGEGSERALALKEFSGMILAKFPFATRFWPHIMHKNVTSGESHQFPAVGFVDADEHTPGTDITGSGQPPKEERIVPTDEKELVSSVSVNKVDEYIQHYDERHRYAIECVNGIGRQVDSRSARMACQGARRTERVVTYEDEATQTFDSGILVQRNAATVADGYPMTIEGSIRLQDDLGTVAQQYEERNVPEDFRVAFLTPYLKGVLLKDRGITSKDWVDDRTNQLLSRIVQRIQSFRIEISNQVPNTNVTTKEPAYRGDYSKTAVVCLGHQAAVGAAIFGNGINAFGPTWYEAKRIHLLGAAMFSGIKWLRPEGCAEIYAASTPYALNGDGSAYVPA